MSYDEDMLLENDLNPKNKSKHERIIDQLKDIEEFDYNDMAPTPTKQTESSFLPSSMLKDQKKKSKDDDYDNDDYDPDKWFGDLIGARNGISKTRKKIKSDLFDEYGITNKKKKKKKKKNKDGDFVDYKQEFEPEMALYKNLLVAQNKFTDSLQREYDAIKSVKSSARGVSKQMSDLIENITEARALSMQLVDKHVNVKKQIAELNIKQKEKFGKNAMDGENMSDYASSYLKQMLMDRNAILDPGGNATIGDYFQSGSNVKISALWPGPVNTNFNNVANVRFSLKGLSSEYVAKYGIDNLLKGKRIIVPGWIMKISTIASKIAPSNLVLKIIYHQQRRKN